MTVEIQNLITDLHSKYTARIGERGIKVELTRDMFRIEPKIRRKDAMLVLRESLDMSAKGASTYYQNHRPKAVHMEESRTLRNTRPTSSRQPESENTVILNKEQFLKIPLVSCFTEHFSRLISGNKEYKHSYDITHAPWKAAKGPHWECESLPMAMNSYWWHGSLQENSKVLDNLRENLKKAIEDGQNHTVFLICIKILDWGGVYKGSIGFLIEKYESDSLIDSIKDACVVLEGSQLNLNAFDNKQLRMDSGMTKIYSLYCKKSIIYDDRVASAITLIAHRLLKEDDYSPEDRNTLRGLKIFGHGDKEKQKSHDQMSYGINQTNHARFNLLANWLISDSIEKARGSNNESVKKCWKTELDIPLSRKIEAALFMIGSDVSSGR